MPNGSKRSAGLAGTGEDALKRATDEIVSKREHNFDDESANQVETLSFGVIRKMFLVVCVDL